jgi:methionyl-tRNA synthetase
LARSGNKYLAETEPWKLIKEDKERVATILNMALQIVGNLAILGEPFLPDTARKINQILNLESSKWASAGTADLLSEGHQINEAVLLFEKIEDQEIAAQIKKLEDTKVSNEAAEAGVSPQKPEITYDDFAKLDIRIGTVLEAEKLPKSKKLLKLKIDTGVDQRTILSGIAQHFEPEALIGKQVTVLINLAPRKMMGLESEGMVLMAEDANGDLKLVQPEAKVTSGSEVN